MANPDPIDRPVGGQSTDQYRAFKSSALAVRGMREQECSSLLLCNSAAKLPADQRMHLAILVYGFVNDMQ
jgi:hypothetical protein